MEMHKQGRGSVFQNGFTLIELMIVVAIIGVLAAIALPSYLRYAARAQAVEALTVTDGTRQAIALYLYEAGHLDVLNATDPQAVSIRNAASALEGLYVGVVSIHDANGSVGVSFDEGALSGGGLRLEPRVAGNQISGWRCIGDGSVLGAGEAVKADYLPRACR